MTDSVRVDQPRPAVGPAPMPRRPVRLFGWLAGIGIGAALLIMIGAALIRPAWTDPAIPMPRIGPPWQLTNVPVSPELVTIALWAAAVLALGGVVAGLLAARWGARGPLRLIFVAAAVAVVALTVLPPVGSTDALDYAAYGRILLVGHNPYQVTPIYLRLTEPFFGQSIPGRWQYAESLYGPAATFEQYLAARLGGDSMARVVLWLKFWNAFGFAAVAVVLDRVLRSRPAARLRAHLLWTINPLLLWDLMASGHVDVLAAAAGVIGLLIVGRQPADGRSWRPRVSRALAAGALIGLAADIKIDYLIFGLALAWALRRSLPALAAAGCGAFVVLVPTYAWLGKPAFQALFNRGDETTLDSPWRSADLTHWKYLLVVAVLLFAMLAALLLWRLPAGDPVRPAIRPAVALSLAFLLVWPYQLPWYDAMIIGVLVLYPATWIDWLVLARLTAATIANIPGDPDGVPSPHLYQFDIELVHGLAPVVLLAVSAAVVVLAVTGWWRVVRT
ncbi:MAG: hypothetical protein ACRDOK_05695 [Streptosporangiaceae bacterium]